METIVYLACLEPCDVVSDQHKNACLIGLFEAKLWEIGCHWARTSHLRKAQNSAGTSCSAHCLLSHTVGRSLGHFFFCFVSHAWGRYNYSQKPHFFFLTYISSKILWELKLLRFLIGKYQLSLQTLETF